MNKTIDNKEQNVMALSAGTMGVSVAITLIPGDTGTTLAEKLSDMSGYMFLVLIGLYLKKYYYYYQARLHSVYSFRQAAFSACIIFSFERGFAGRLGAKMIVFGIAVFALVPTSVSPPGCDNRQIRQGGRYVINGYIITVSNQGLG